VRRSGYRGEDEGSGIRGGSGNGGGDVRRRKWIWARKGASDGGVRDSVGGGW